MADRATNDLTRGPVAASLFRLTAPMMVAVSTSIVVQMIEVGFIGALGTDPLAAVTFTFPVSMMLTSVALGIGIGTSSVIARRVGAGDADAVRRLATHALVLVVTLLAALAILGMATIEPLFAALGASSAVIGHIETYLLVYYPGTVLFTFVMVAGNVMRATGDARVPGLVMTAGALLNLALDPFLIFGWGPFPRLELAGAAYAMVVSRIAMAAVLGFVLVARRGLVLPRARLTEGFAGSAREILHVGLPAMATQLIGPVSAAVITRLLAGHGEAVVAGFGVAGRIEAVAVMLLFALSGSIGPFVGQNWGAGAHARVVDAMRVTYRFCIAWGLFAWLVLALAAPAIVPLVDDSRAVVDVASHYLAIVPVSYGAWGVLMMASAAFNSLGKPIPSTILSATRMLALNVPLAMAGDALLGYSGIFYATCATNVVMGLLGYVWLQRAFLTPAAHPRA
jgi:putative MATE family efflux protein